MKLKPIFQLLLTASLLLLLACSDSRSDEPLPRANGGVFDPPPSPGAFPQEQEAEFTSSTDMPRSSGNIVSEEAISAERLIVRNVSMTFLVDSIRSAVINISSAVRQMNGFIVSSHISGDDGDEYGLIAFRVPAEKTDEVLSQIRAMAIRVTYESSQTSDVTEEYVDSQARLNNLERTEEQYIRLFGQAKTVEDMLKVQRELSNVQGQIEMIKGQMHYLERTSATSLISINLHLTTSIEPLVQPGWSFPETVKDASRSLIKFGQWASAAAIWVVIYTPVWAPILVVIYLATLWLRRLRGSQKVPAAQETC